MRILSSKYLLIILSIISLTIIHDMFGQSKYTLSDGTISFFSSAPLEDIRAETKSFKSVIYLKEAKVTFTVPIAGFIFEKRLMQKHFNDQYMESEKFPSAFFTGTFDQTLKLNATQDTSLKTRVKGTISIKGVTRPLDEEVLLRVTGDEITGNSKFKVRLQDFGIKVPKILIKNIAEVVEVTIDVIYKTEG